MREIYQCTGCQARFREGEVKPVYLRNPDGVGHFIECPKCGRLKGVKDLRMPPPIPVPDDDRPPVERRPCGHEHHPKDGPCGKLSQIPEGPSRRGISTATATVLGMVAALTPEPTPRPSIGGQEQCTNCGRVEGHAPDCRPPRGVRKV